MRAHEVTCHESNAMPQRADGYDRYALGDLAVAERRQKHRDLATGLAILASGYPDGPVMISGAQEPAPSPLTVVCVRKAPRPWPPSNRPGPSRAHSLDRPGSAASGYRRATPRPAAERDLRPSCSA